LAVQRSPCAWSAATNVGCKFVAEFRGLKIAGGGTVQLLATIPAGAGAIGRMIANLMADL
jgi:hypothetical protein